ncbi:methyltransferase, partial [Candidatus Woesearchaeota archaeon]|nr:methyltransferase [Candidatus Woesearchaeota archaeon]
MVYEPQEDSHLLRQCLPKDLSGKKVVEVGCGSGVISVACAQRGGDVVAVDVDPAAVAATRKAARDARVTVVACEGDLFGPVRDERFDYVICNPPYLPTDPKRPDVALDGGPEGWEFTARFLKEASDHLTDSGKALLLFSSHTKPDKVAALIHENKFSSKLLGKKEVGFFEEVFVVELVQD